MSRQQKMALSMMASQGQFRPISRGAVHNLPGFVIDLDNKPDSQQMKTCVHICDYNDDLVVHIRKFKNGIPTRVGVAYNHSGWLHLMELLPTLDDFVRGTDGLGVPKVLLALDAERSVVILNGGAPNAQVVFQREDKDVILCLDQWMALVDSQACIQLKIMEHIKSVIAKLEARD